MKRHGSRALFLGVREGLFPLLTLIRRLPSALIRWLGAGYTPFLKFGGKVENDPCTAEIAVDIVPITAVWCNELISF